MISCQAPFAGWQRFEPDLKVQVGRVAVALPFADGPDALPTLHHITFAHQALAEVGVLAPYRLARRQAVLDQEIARGFATRGLYRKRLGYFIDGLAIGTEQFIRDQIARLREEGQYLRRKNPIPQLGGIHLSIREQRSTAVIF